LKAEFSRLLPSEGTALNPRGERNIWQRRFWEHAIRDEGDLERHLNYIHFNAVKHGYVSSPNDWPYSSWHGWKKHTEADLPKPVDINLAAGERS
jgi:putative transposase